MPFCLRGTASTVAAMTLWGAGAKLSETATASNTSPTAVATLATTEATALWDAYAKASGFATAAAGFFSAMATLAT